MTEQDLLRRFLFEDLGVRGEWVKLTTSWQAAKQHQQGPLSKCATPIGAGFGSCRHVVCDDKI